MVKVKENGGYRGELFERVKQKLDYTLELSWEQITVKFSKCYLEDGLLKELFLSLKATAP